MKEVKPKIRPSQRMKKRYVLFQSKAAGFEEVREKLFFLGVKPLHLIEFDPVSGQGIVRCERGLERKLRQAMEKAGFKPLKTSGTLKRLRQLPKA